MSLPNEINPQLLASSARYTIDNSVRIGGVEGEFFYHIFAERKDVDKLTVEY